MSLRDPKIQKVLLVYFFLAGFGYMYFMSKIVPFSYPNRTALLVESREKAAELRRAAPKQPRPTEWVRDKKKQRQWRRLLERHR